MLRPYKGGHRRRDARQERNRHRTRQREPDDRHEAGRVAPGHVVHAAHEHRCDRFGDAVRRQDDAHGASQNAHAEQLESALQGARDLDEDLLRAHDVVDGGDRHEDVRTRNRSGIADATST